MGYARYLVDAAVRRRAHERADRAVLHDLSWAGTDAASGAGPGQPRLEGLPAGLTLRWLGTAGYELAYEGTRVLIDPYVSRLPLGDFARRRVVDSSSGLVDRWLPRADAVLVGHTHFDHALDVPAVARRDGCPVYGSTSMTHLLGLHGLAEQAVTVEPYRRYKIGPFVVTFVPSAHSKLFLGRSVPSGGELTCDHLDHLTPQAYRCGQVWGIHLEVAGTTLYHQGSAEVVDDAVRHHGVDIFLCGVAGRQFSDRYVERILRLLAPDVVVPMHYDDFFLPLAEPMGFSFGVDLARFGDEVGEASRLVELRALPLG